MSGEIALIATVQVAAGKVDRFRELMESSMKWIQANEPETLQFTFVEEQTEHGTKIAMFERYASKAALDRHESSDSYQTFFKTVMEEELLMGAPVMVKGPVSQASVSR